MIKFVKCKGNGQGVCYRCSENGNPTPSWMCFLYKIEGLPGVYCFNCLKAIKEYEA